MHLWVHTDFSAWQGITFGRLSPKQRTGSNFATPPRLELGTSHFVVLLFSTELSPLNPQTQNCTKSQWFLNLRSNQALATSLAAKVCFDWMLTHCTPRSCFYSQVTQSLRYLHSWIEHVILITMSTNNPSRSVILEYSVKSSQGLVGQKIQGVNLVGMVWVKTLTSD